MNQTPAHKTSGRTSSGLENGVGPELIAYT